MKKKSNQTIRKVTLDGISYDVEDIGIDADRYSNPGPPPICEMMEEWFMKTIIDTACIKMRIVLKDSGYVPYQGEISNRLKVFADKRIGHDEVKSNSRLSKRDWLRMAV